MGKKKMIITYEAVCNECNGSGHIQGKACRVCGATGFVDITKDIDITVKPSGTREVKFYHDSQTI